MQLFQREDTIHLDDKTQIQCLSPLSRRDILRKLQSHRDVSALHVVQRPRGPAPHEGALHGLKWRHLRVQLWLLPEWNHTAVWTLHRVSRGPGYAVQLWLWSWHDVRGVRRRRHVLGPGELSGALHPLRHLRRWANAVSLHRNLWYGLSR